MAHKECNPNGTWFRHPNSGLVWSNYTTCVNMDDLNWRQQVNRIYEIGYFISLVALLLSLFILYHFKHFRVESARFAVRGTFAGTSYLPVRFTVSSYVESLRCARTTLHMHLFASFAVNNALWLLWYRLIVNDPDAIMNNGVECQILHVVLHYFLLANYAWMLCEGFYLHTLLVNAFISESRLVKWLCVLGWAVPVVIIVVYTALRAAGPGKDTSECWINENKYSLVLAVPVCVSMVLNLGFLCNILRVLLVKLRAAPHVGSARPSNTLLQAVRATLLLVPLLGLNYLVTPFRPPPGHYYEKAYEVISATTSSLQGLCVAIMFCFCNGEVVAQIKRKWQHLMFRPRANSCTATTVSGWSLLSWGDSIQFCEACGGRLETTAAGTQKKCSACGVVRYPALSPVGITLVTNEDRSRALLVRQHIHPPGMFTCIAGFIEVGESVEENVKREVAEEVGLEAREIEYVGSQHWALPASRLMIGCIAVVTEVEFSLDKIELEAAAWCTPQQVHSALTRVTDRGRRLLNEHGHMWVPPRGAIAHDLMWHWLRTSHTS